MSNLDMLLERANDCLAQTRCDRRSLATLAKSLHEKGEFVSSTSKLLRLIIEDLRLRHIAEGAVDIMSYDDADNILKALGMRGLNSGDRQMGVYLRQLGKEDLFHEGLPLSYAMRPRTTLKMIENAKRQADADKEDRQKQALEIAKDLRRRKDELKRVEQNLASVPGDLIKKEESKDGKNEQD
jgi:hypothetical protein